MKNIKIIVTNIALLILVFILNQNAFGCTMFKLTIYGKTMVGNNEDYWNPNSRIWFEHGKVGEYGAVYVGYDNFWPQGGMNQAGLVFDGFSMDYLAINDTLGKKSLDANFLQDLMRKCVNVDDVKKYFAQYNLTGLETSMFLFIDKTGKYLVVEGDSLITGNNQSYVLSNFYPSQIKEENEIEIPFYHKGKKLLESHKDTTISFCSSVMDTMHQERNWGAGTMFKSKQFLAFKNTILPGCDPYISRNGDYMIFSSLKEGGYGQGDLCVCFNDGSENWSKAYNLGSEINTEYFEYGPLISPDEKYLFFSRREKWENAAFSDIYWVSIKVIDKYRNAEKLK